MIDLSPRIFETIMLVCFGCSWPFAIAKTVRTKTAKGKSIVFIALIFVGYMAGIIFKVIGHLDGVILLYITNGSLVFTEILLYFKYKQPADKNRGHLTRPQWEAGRQAIIALKDEAACN